MAEKTKTSRDEQVRKLLGELLGPLTVILAIATVAALFYGGAAGLSHPALGATSRVLGGAMLAFLVSCGAFSTGVLAAVIFGVPRTLSSTETRLALAVLHDSVKANGENCAQSSLPTPDGRQGINTNLEQISDWLTKIIVGVGLTKLEAIPSAIQSLGERIGYFFGSSGSLFGAAACVTFSMLGFVIGYILTRSKLSWMLAWGQAMESSGVADSQTRISEQAPPISSEGLAGITDPVVQQADAATLARNQAELSDNQRIAYANAAARLGHRETAADLYRQEAPKRTGDPQFMVNYAGVLSLAGDETGTQKVLRTIEEQSPSVLPEAREKADLATLRSGLYDQGYERSIEAGERLLARPSSAADPWIHVWLACAYGQRHAALQFDIDAPDAADRMKHARDRVVDEITAALRLQPSLQSYLRTLYDPAFKDPDNDLTSLFHDPDLDRLLGVTPA